VNILIEGITEKRPIKINNSEIKLKVNGKPILAKENIKK